MSDLIIPTRVRDLDAPPCTGVVQIDCWDGSQLVLSFPSGWQAAAFIDCLLDGLLGDVPPSASAAELAAWLMS